MPYELNGTYLTVEEAAARAGRSIALVRAACKRGEIPGAVLIKGNPARSAPQAGLWLIEASELDRWIETRVSGRRRS